MKQKLGENAWLCGNDNNSGNGKICGGSPCNYPAAARRPAINKYKKAHGYAIHGKRQLHRMTCYAVQVKRPAR